MSSQIAHGTGSVMTSTAAHPTVHAHSIATNSSTRDRTALLRVVTVEVDGKSSVSKQALSRHTRLWRHRASFQVSVFFPTCQLHTGTCTSYTWSKITVMHAADTCNCRQILTIMVNNGDGWNPAFGKYVQHHNQCSVLTDLDETRQMKNRWYTTKSCVLLREAHQDRYCTTQLTRNWRAQSRQGQLQVIHNIYWSICALSVLYCSYAGLQVLPCSKPHSPNRHRASTHIETAPAAVAAAKASTVELSVQT